jgi:hypothetical protein
VKLVQPFLLLLKLHGVLLYREFFKFGSMKNRDIIFVDATKDHLT